MLADSLDHGGHDAATPVGPGEPIADLGTMRLADLEIVEAASADQRVLRGPNGKMSRLALLLGNLGVPGEPFIGRALRVRRRDTKRAVIDFRVVEMLDERRLVGQAKVRQVDLI